MPLRRFLAPVAVLALALAGCGVTPTAAPSDPPQQVEGFTASCTTSSTGYCTVAHPLGVAPIAVTATPRAAVIVAVGARTASTLRVRLCRSLSSSGACTPFVGTSTLDFVATFVPGPLPTATPTASPSVTTSPTPSTTPTTTPPTTTPPTGWPDAGNTGVPAGTALTAYTGPCTITVADTVLDAKTIACDLEIQAPRVVISRSRITGAVNTPDSLTTTASFTLTDSEVAYPTVTNAGRTQVGAVNFTVLRSEITGGNRGVYCRKNCELRDSWVHGTVVTGTLHASAVRMSQDATIVHNTLHCDVQDAGDAGCSANLTGYGDFEPVRDNLVQGNLFKATPGGACAYGGSSGGKPFTGDTQGIVFRDNTFERGPGGKCGSYFPITDFDPGAPGNLWTGNVWADGGTVPPG